jgi:THO complex subunit 3
MTLSESRYIQQCPLKVTPIKTNYSPDGKHLLYTTAGHQLCFMDLRKEGEETKESWHASEKNPVRT